MRYLLFLLLIIAFAAKGQQPFVRDFSLTESATPLKVNAIVQDKTGYIWLGTDEGVMRYNGQSFLRIADNIHQPVTAIAADHGNVWVGYANGKTGIVDNDTVKKIEITNKPASAINCIYALGDHVLMLATEDGITLAFNNQGTQFSTANGLSDNFSYAISKVAPNRFVIGTDKGMDDVTLTDGKLVINKITTVQGLPDNIVRVIKKVPNSATYLLGTQNGGIAVYNSDNRKIEVPACHIQWQWGQVNDILPISDKHAWVATEDGYLLDLDWTDSTNLQVHPFHYTDKKFQKLIQDKAGNIWCATNKGMTLLTAEYVVHIPLSEPYSLHGTTAMAWSNDTLWIALKEHLYKLSVLQATPQLIRVYDAPATITSLYVDKNKGFWIGTWGKGVFYKNNNRPVIKMVDIPSSGNSNILNITGTSTAIWIAGLNGVDELSYPDAYNDITLLKHHDKESGIGSNYVYQLYPDHNEHIWMATDGAGVCMYDGKQYHRWNEFLSKSHVAYTMAEDTYGNIWAGTLYKDLYRYRNGSWENLRRHETQYADINISTVAANATGQVISVYQRCIDEWYPNSNYYRHFNSAMGVGIDSTSNVLNCVAKDKAGNVYLPFQHGILVFKNQRQQFDIKPSIHISNVIVDLKPVAASKHTFNYDENYLGFSFDGISYANHERLNYRYILQGYNNDWIKTNDISVSFPQLPPGKYVFRVQVSLNPFFDYASEDDYSFVIKSPVWLTPWFYLPIIFLCFLIAYSYIRLREKRIKSISKLQQEKMMFEYEHLKSQVNPHFLFNSINTLTALIEDDKDAALNYTVHLSDLYRNMLVYLNNDIIALSEECEILDNYVYIQKSRLGNALEIKQDIPKHVMQTKKIVPLALQLLVENAIKHNIVSASQPLTILIKASETEITISNIIQPKISKEKGAGLGLSNIKSRYALLTKREVVFGVRQNEYVIILPLL